MFLGAHVPTTGGLANAPGHGAAVGAEAIQVFTRNQMQWRCRPLGEDEPRAFQEAVKASGVRVVLAHGSYLVNLASPATDFREKSRECFQLEMERCHALGIPYVVFHPGAHMGEGEAKGLAAIARSLDHILARTRGLLPMPLLEMTAGQGTSLGHRFSHIAEILSRVKQPERLGVCLDTCHLYAAGYDLASPEGYEAMFSELQREVSLAALKAVHLNDSKRELGSRVDRHARPGQGHLGIETFRRIVNDRRFAGVPLVLETPGPLAEWKKDVALLRGMIVPARVPARRAPTRTRAVP